ncbi:MAG: hypothetical protein CL675_04695 [Bdellovibrionaceae bacterium]|nr:hypothetical protein [Pseudobdellovibrionaceae bacterium]|tara:strand:+ start:384 stop:779 length:396 start_codon:yes stop_codon:yes gene_type:complete
MFSTDLKVLIVDDMLTMRKIVTKSCRDLGFKNFVEAADGALAWKTLNENPDVGLIISDWNMPNMSGLDFLKRVRADSKFAPLPFVLLTAESELEQVKTAVAAGVDNYIVKPFTPSVLQQKLDQVYQKKNAA